VSLPEFVVAVWVIPHKAYGYFAEIDASLVDDGLPGGVYQNFQDVGTPHERPDLRPEFPHRDFVVSADQVRHLIRLADQIRYSFAEHPYTPRSSVSSFGLRVARGYQEATIIWLGRYEDQDEPIRNLYAAVNALAEA